MDTAQVLQNAMSAVLGSGLTIFLTPKLQHYFWKRQRKAELQLKAIEAVNEMTSDFIQSFIADRSFKPSLDWHKRFSGVSASVKVLFTAETYGCFKELEKRIDPELGAVEGPPRLGQFLDARDAALRALYHEVMG
jgi:hypothetical protein